MCDKCFDRNADKKLYNIHIALFIYPFGIFNSCITTIHFYNLALQIN